MEYKKHYEACGFIKESCKNCRKLIARQDFPKHTKESCTYEILIQFKQVTYQKIRYLKDLSKHLLKRLEEEENIMGLKCLNCHKFACEVS